MKTSSHITFSGKTVAWNWYSILPIGNHRFNRSFCCQRRSAPMGVNTTTHTFNAMHRSIIDSPAFSPSLTHPTFRRNYVTDSYRSPNRKAYLPSKGAENVSIARSMDAAGMLTAIINLVLHDISRSIARKGDRLVRKHSHDGSRT